MPTRGAVRVHATVSHAHGVVFPPTMVTGYCTVLRTADTNLSVLVPLSFGGVTRVSLCPDGLLSRETRICSRTGCRTPWLCPSGAPLCAAVRRPLISAWKGGSLWACSVQPAPARQGDTTIVVRPCPDTLLYASDTRHSRTVHVALARGAPACETISPIAVVTNKPSTRHPCDQLYTVGDPHVALWSCNQIGPCTRHAT